MPDTPGLEPTIGEVIRRLDAIDRRLDKVIDDHEIRLRKVERWVYAVPPALLIAAASLAAALFKAG